jgi:protoporphyrin/coproporphyrin ferrochelatase
MGGADLDRGRKVMTALPAPEGTGPKPPGHPKVATGKIGVLLMNLGTPEGTDYWSVRRYLKEFLSDRRVIETNRLLWWFILNGIILTTRPSRSGHAYERIWNRELNESPLKTITRAQATKVANAMMNETNVIVDWAMRYGSPAVAERLRSLKDAGCERILLFPLYPQYSASTTATALDAVYDELKKMRWQPAIRTVPPYFDHPAYIETLARSITIHLDNLGWQPDLILASFHGLPESYFAAGDPYYCHCQKTARLLRAALNLPGEKLEVVFQSRFGRAEWLKPYAQETVETLPARGVKKLVMIAPGFSADCLETLEELGIGLDEKFRSMGGERFSLVPCLNDSEGSINLLDQLVREELAGWLG